jgi:tRNA threonylcarbamoyl adenosine modification protein YjeE
VSLKGELGAGKTVFARGFIAEWLRLSGESATTAVTSPSYNVARVYGTRMPLAHLDLYRIESAAELAELGLEHYFHEHSCCLVEWLENGPGIASFVPAGALEVELVFGAGSEHRLITVRALTGAS